MHYDTLAVPPSVTAATMKRDVRMVQKSPVLFPPKSLEDHNATADSEEDIRFDENVGRKQTGLGGCPRSRPTRNKYALVEDSDDETEDRWENTRASTVMWMCQRNSGTFP